MTVHPLLRRVRRELEEAADPDRAAPMRAYMKSEMPFHGVPPPQMRAACKRVFAEHAVDDAEAWRSDVLGLWRGARFREERYAAIELAGDRRARAFQTMASLAMYEEMIVDGAWWDFVDGIASSLVGQILRNEPAAMRRAMLAWSRDADLWKRRTSILCQLTLGAKTDLTLLYGCIEPSLGRKELFLRKAIGWSLRQYAKTDADEVVRWVEEHRDRLAPLSVREALKHVTGSRGAGRPSSSPPTFFPARGGRQKSA